MLIRRTRKTFAGHTDERGVRKLTAPPSWPFGTVQPAVSKAKPRVRKNVPQFDIDCKPPTQKIVDGNDLLMGVGEAPW